MKFLKSKLFKVTSIASAGLGVGVKAFATAGESLLDTEATALVSGFAADLVPTVLALIGILVPVGLTLWAIGFAVKKGLSFLQRRANKSI